MVTEIELLEITDHSVRLFFFGGGGLDRQRSLQTKVDTADEALTRILDAASSIKTVKIS